MVMVNPPWLKTRGGFQKSKSAQADAIKMAETSVGG